MKKPFSDVPQVIKPQSRREIAIRLIELEILLGKISNVVDDQPEAGVFKTLYGLLFEQEEGETNCIAMALNLLGLEYDEGNGLIEMVRGFIAVGGPIREEIMEKSFMIETPADLVDFLIEYRRFLLGPLRSLAEAADPEPDSPNFEPRELQEFKDRGFERKNRHD